jgi:aldehyde:ferredoxin oxidoreductase
MSSLTAGKILQIDFADQKITTEPTAPYEKKFIMGTAIAANLEEMKTQCYAFQGRDQETVVCLLRRCLKNSN